jgi:hypothetical protein
VTDARQCQQVFFPKGLPKLHVPQRERNVRRGLWWSLGF